jgi:hypothetical protein
MMTYGGDRAPCRLGSAAILATFRPGFHREQQYRGLHLFSPRINHLILALDPYYA